MTLIRKRHVQNMAVVLPCLLVLSGCGRDFVSDSAEESETKEKIEQDASEAEEDEFEVEQDESEEEQDDSIAEQDGTISKKDAMSKETSPVFDTKETKNSNKENDILEIYDAGDKITVSEDAMIAQLAPEEILRGNPILYDRFRIDGWVFEWLISDYYDEDEWSMEDGVLLVSREESTEDAQIIHVTAEGGYGTWVLAENKFEYADVNFDAVPDLLICTGHHGNQGLLTYYCFLQTKDGFAEAPTFTDIPNPAVDEESQLILSQWRNSAVSHSWAEYRCQDNTYVKHRELCEDLELSGDEEIWIWTVNGEEAARSDELSEDEIGEFLYGENSEWKLADDRWRTLYNSGLTVDYSIYAEP